MTNIEAKKLFAELKKDRDNLVCWHTRVLDGLLHGCGALDGRLRPRPRPHSTSRRVR